MSNFLCLRLTGCQVVQAGQTVVQPGLNPSDCSFWNIFLPPRGGLVQRLIRPYAYRFTSIFLLTFIFIPVSEPELYIHGYKIKLQMRIRKAQKPFSTGTKFRLRSRFLFTSEVAVFWFVHFLERKRYDMVNFKQQLYLYCVFILVLFWDHTNVHLEEFS